MPGDCTCIECGEPSDYELNPSGLWCTKCELDRRARISASMEVISEGFEEGDR